MKTLVLALVVTGSYFASNVARAEEYSVDRVIASSSAAKAASEFLLDVNDVKDRPFTVQVASHLNELKAIEHVKELKAHQESAFYYPNFIKNQVFFKVCVGRFASKNEADAFVSDFIKRTSETFSNVISLLDRPGADKKATAAQVSSAEAMKKKEGQARSIASISSKSINLIEEVSPAAHKPEAKAKANTVAANMPVEAKSVTTANPSEPEAAHADAPAAPAAAATPATTEPTKIAGKKSYSVQIAAYPFEEMAKVATAKVEAPGKDVFYKAAVVDGKTWYRLYVGKFDTYADATAYKKEIEHTYDSPIVRKLYE